MSSCSPTVNHYTTKMMMNLSVASFFVSFLLASTTPAEAIPQKTPECGVDLNKDKLIATSALCGETSLTADCLEKIDMTNVGRSCLSRLTDDVLDNMKSKTAGEILAGKILDLPESAKLFTALFKKNDWTKNKAEAFLQAAAGNRDFSNAIMEGLTGDPELMARFFAGCNADRHSTACAKMSKESVQFISTTFFTKMSRNCFRVVPAETFEGFDSDKFAAIHSALLTDISIAQAVRIPGNAFSGMTAEQLKNWGGPYSPPVSTDKDAVKAYLETHPCSQAKRMLSTVKVELRRSLRTQCKMEEGAAKGPASYSMTLLGFSVAIAFYLAI